MAQDESSLPALLAARLYRLVDMARALILGGRTVDLAGLNDRVGLLCAQMLDMDHAEARALLPKIQHITTQLDALSAALTQDRAPPT